MKEETELRRQLTILIRGSQSHMPLSEAVKDFPLAEINTKPANVTYSFWHLLEHIRITQSDIIDYMINPSYKERKWPDEYWPVKSAKADGTQWGKTIASIESDLVKLEKMANDPELDLFAQIPHGAKRAHVLP